MKFWTITFPGEFGQHVVETWNEDQIIRSYYNTYWYAKMVQAGKADQATKENCILDWITVHWGVETDGFGNKIKESK